MRSTTPTLPEAQKRMLLADQAFLSRSAAYVHYRYLNQSFGNEYDRQDVLQEAWSDMLTANVYPPAESDQLRAWAYSYIKRRAITRLDRIQRQRLAAIGYHEQWQNNTPENSEELVAEVLRISKLVCSPIERQVLEYRAAGIPGPEIAEALGVTNIVVRGRFFRAKKVLLSTPHNWD